MLAEARARVKAGALDEALRFYNKLLKEPGTKAEKEARQEAGEEGDAA